MSFVLKFLTGFVLKYLTTQALEKVVLIFLKKLVDSTDSKVDNEIYDALFKKIEKE